MEKRMLIIEEDSHSLAQLEQFYESFFVVSGFKNGLQGLVKTIELKPEVILLSHSLPNVDSIELCHQIRQNLNSIIIVMGKNLTEDKMLKYFEAGSDDVVDQPINFKVLLCKITAKLNRLLSIQKRDSQENIVQFGKLLMNRNTYKVFYDKKELSFTKKEFSILWTLVTKQDAVVTRVELLRVVWSYEHLDDDRMIDTHLNRMRKKLKQYDLNLSIKTVWGIGYKLQIDDFLSDEEKMVN